MKHKILVNILVLFVAVFSFSCFEEDDKYTELIPADADIQFVVADAALVAPPAGQPQVAQPSFDVVGARFSRVGNLIMTINVSSTEYTNLTVNLVVTASGVRQTKATFTNVSGKVDWTYPMATIGLNNTQPAVSGTVVLEFVATNADGSKKVVRVFTVTALA